MGADRKKALFLCAGILFSLTFPTKTLFAQPTLALQSGNVVMKGFTPSGRVLLYAVGGERVGWVDQLFRLLQVLQDEDGDGQLTYSPQRAIPTRSLWVAADLASGQVALAVPAEYPYPFVAELPGQAIPQGSWVRAFVLARSAAHVLVVRPGQGAWLGRVKDGNPNDGDGSRNGAVELPFSAMTSIVGEPAPLAALQPRDTLVVVDPENLQAGVLQLPTTANP
jgi:hypothetical protein